LLKDSSLLKIHFGISGDFFTYFLLQYFQRTLFRFTFVFADCKDSNFILIPNNLSSHFFQANAPEKLSLQPCFKNNCLSKADAKISALRLNLQIFF